MGFPFYVPVGEMDKPSPFHGDDCRFDSDREQYHGVRGRMVNAPDCGSGFIVGSNPIGYPNDRAWASGKPHPLGGWERRFNSCRSDKTEIIKLGHFF